MPSYITNDLPLVASLLASPIAPILFSIVSFRSSQSTFHKTIRFRRVHFATDIIDTAGMDEYSRLSRNASVGVHGYVMMYSITSLQSFQKISQINTTLLNMLGDAPDVPRILVGSMSDLQSERAVTTAQGQELADEWGVPFMECSSLKDENIR